MSDLRTGLVEAIRDALAAAVWHEGKRGQKPITGYAEHRAVLTVAASGEMIGFDWSYASEVALDAALDFLTDNAKGWADHRIWECYQTERAGEPTHDFCPTDEMVLGLIAALSDSRDTGEKP